jgi:hypothetical protein
VASGTRPSLQSELGDWLEGSSRFRDFIAANQDKVRKKLASSDEESRQDVRSELLVAYLIVADRRFAIEFEAYGARQAGPDLSITFRTNQRFNLEVTRLRSVAAVARLANVIAGKLRQLPGEVPNALVMTGRDVSLSEELLVAAVRLLKTHTDSKDDEFFERRGFLHARDFHNRYLRLGGVFGLDETTTPRSVVFLANREARHALPTDVVAGLSACFS